MWSLRSRTVDFNYAELLTATRALLAGAELISGGRDRNYPDLRRHRARHGRSHRGAGVRDRRRPHVSSASPIRRCSRSRSIAWARDARW